MILVRPKKKVVMSLKRLSTAEMVVAISRDTNKTFKKTTPLFSIVRTFLHSQHLMCEKSFSPSDSIRFLIISSYYFSAALDSASLLN